MLDLLRMSAADVEWLGSNEIRVHAADVRTQSSTRSSAGAFARRSCSPDPLLSRLGRAACSARGRHHRAAAARPAHPRQLTALGAEIEFERRWEMRADRSAARPTFNRPEPPLAPRLDRALPAWSRPEPIRMILSRAVFSTRRGRR